MVAFEEATGDEPSRGPNVAIATNCPNGHFDVWLVAEAVKFQAPQAQLFRQSGQKDPGSPPGGVF